MTFFIGLYKLHRSITLPCRSFSDALALGVKGFAAWLEIVGRKSDGEAWNIGIKGDASDHTPGACAASVAILGLSSGRALWFHESCGRVYGSVPRNSERENLGEAKDQEDEEAVMDFREGLHAGLLVAFSILDALSGVDVVAVASCLVSGLYLDFCHNQCWDNLELCSHGIRRILGMLSQNLKVERNPEAGWTVVKESIGCVNLQGDLLVYPFDSKSSSLGRPLLIPRWILGSNGTVILLQNPEMLLGPEGHFWSPEAALDPKVAFRTRRLSKDPKVISGVRRSHLEPEGTRRSFGNPEVLDPEVVFRTRRSFRDPGVVWEPGGSRPEVVFRTRMSFRDPMVVWEPEGSRP
ncbi:hypothetical protein DY000_02049582 [Brassica cretica]|uniref:Anaphase-promoting complex subunit 1 n=1 Tax=Brassica cretica TaxID=69181 RepID=A0ABQ7EZ39_BRACR|nr:hypothetical protein DY000_02049582 [Brassica cretica]